jgi:hypothetical protein
VRRSLAGQRQPRRGGLSAVRPVIVLAILWVGAARADDAVPPATPVESAGKLTVRASDETGEPLLHLDPMFTTPLERSLLATVEREEAGFDLGRASHARLSAEHWSDAGTNARGVNAGLELSHDFGFARLVVRGAMNHVQGRFGSGTALSAGIALVRTLWRSRWTNVWLSLGLDYQQRLGQPGTNRGVTLSISGTFR